MKFEVMAHVYLSLVVALPCAYSATQVDMQPVLRSFATGQNTASNRREAPGGEPSRRVSFGRRTDTSTGSRQTIRSDAPLHDYSAYRVGDRYYILLPQASADGDVRQSGGRGYMEMRVQRHESGLLVSYRLRPGVSARVEQRFGRLDVVFEDKAGGTSAARQRQKAETAGEVRPKSGGADTPPTADNLNDSSFQPGELRTHETGERPNATLINPKTVEGSPQPQSTNPTPSPDTPVTKDSGHQQPITARTWAALFQRWAFAAPLAFLVITCIIILTLSRHLKMRKRQNLEGGLAHSAASPPESASAVSGGATRSDEETTVAGEPDTSMNSASPSVRQPGVVGPEYTNMDGGATYTSCPHIQESSSVTQSEAEAGATHIESTGSSTVSEAAYTELLHSPAADPISGSTETEMTVLPAAFDQTTTGSSQPEVYSPPSLNSADGSAPPVGESPAHSVPQNHFSRPVSETPHGDDDEAFESICAAFDDEAEEIRGAAARSLYESSENPVESFTRALREATPERRREIGASIAASGLAQESISQLTGESRERTYEAFSLLFLMAKAGEVQPLLRAIEGHPSNEVRLAVVKLLALSGQKEVLPAFRRLKTQSSLPAEVRDAITEAIYSISSQGESRPATGLLM